MSLTQQPSAILFDARICRDDDYFASFTSVLRRPSQVRLLDATVRRDGPTAEFQAKMQPRNHVERATAEMAYKNVRLTNSARYLRNAPAYSDQRVI